MLYENIFGSFNRSKMGALKLRLLFGNRGSTTSQITFVKWRRIVQKDNRTYNLGNNEEVKHWDFSMVWGIDHLPPTKIFMDLLARIPINFPHCVQKAKVSKSYDVTIHEVR